MNVVLEGREQTPQKIVCIGRNYVAHIQELGNEVPDQMVVFNKPASAIGLSLQSWCDEPLHYEGEIALMVQGGAFAAAAFGLDLTKRALQSRLKEKGLPWERAKAFDGAALFSEFVSISDTDLSQLSLRLDIDGDPVQRGGVELMMYKPEMILRELGTFTTLSDGDIVMTGTPAGVGPVTAGAEYHGQLYAGDSLLSEARWLAH
jgi:2-keto-4-pentenoate hydratase/2-oxohepta-3-ene-1,7-dioic acid hydratase in catechol pathway